MTKMVTQDEYQILKACFDECQRMQGTKGAYQEKTDTEGGDADAFNG
jgi:hypothetical protein